MQCHFYDTGDWEVSQDEGYWNDLVIYSPNWIQRYSEIIGSGADKINCQQLESSPQFCRLWTMFYSKSGESSGLATGVHSICEAPERRTFLLYSTRGLFQDCPRCNGPKQMRSLASSSYWVTAFIPVQQCHLILSIHRDIIILIVEWRNWGSEIPKSMQAISRKAEDWCGSSRCQITCSVLATDAFLPFTALACFTQQRWSCFKSLGSVPDGNAWPKREKQLTRYGTTS